jgi:hypothetical protein
VVSNGRHCHFWRARERHSWQKAYYSNVFPQSADHIWSVIRDFNNYPVWVDGAGESHIEEGNPVMRLAPSATLRGEVGDQPVRAVLAVRGNEQSR